MPPKPAQRWADKPKHLYLPSQPKRCAGQDVGVGGTCLACGARELEPCRAPLSDRPKPARKARHG